MDESSKLILRDMAMSSISYGLEHAQAMPVAVDSFSSELQEQRASFVTLHRKGQLRGCIGTLNAHQALIKDVVDNAYAAAFRDTRFAPLQSEELADLVLHISVLGEPQALSFDSQSDLISQIRPGIDGLILQEGVRRSTFLPSVWEQLPDKVEFLQHLKQKAGLPSDYWSDSVQVSVYQVESF